MYIEVFIKDRLSVKVTSYLEQEKCIKNMTAFESKPLQWKVTVRYLF